MFAGYFKCELDYTKERHYQLRSLKVDHIDDELLVNLLDYCSTHRKSARKLMWKRNIFCTRDVSAPTRFVYSSCFTRLSH